MNLSLGLFVICAVVASATAGRGGHGGQGGPKSEEMKQNAQACKEETGATDEGLKQAVRGEEVTDRNTKCFFACLAKKAGWMTADGALDKEKILGNIPAQIPDDKKEEFKQKRAECIEKSSDADSCETAYLYMKCARPKRGGGGGGRHRGQDSD